MLPATSPWPPAAWLPTCLPCSHRHGRLRGVSPRSGSIPPRASALRRRARANGHGGDLCLGLAPNVLRRQACLASTWIRIWPGPPGGLPGSVGLGRQSIALDPVGSRAESVGRKLSRSSDRTSSDGIGSGPSASSVPARAARERPTPVREAQTPRRPVCRGSSNRQSRREEPGGSEGSSVGCSNSSTRVQGAFGIDIAHDGDDGPDRADRWAPCRGRGRSATPIRSKLVGPAEDPGSA